MIYTNKANKYFGLDSRTVANDIAAHILFDQYLEDKKFVTLRSTADGNPNGLAVYEVDTLLGIELRDHVLTVLEANPASEVMFTLSGE